MTIATRARANDLLTRMNGQMYREAYTRGMSLSGYLETIDPSSDYNDGLDSFGRLCMLAGIRTNSVPEMGIFADTFEKFNTNEQTRALVPEWLARQWRRATLGVPFFATRASGIYGTTEAPGTSQNPWADAAAARARTQIAPAIPLSSVVAFTTPIDSDAYRAYYLDDTAAERRMVRVGQAAEIPRVKITGGDNTIRLYKYGRAMEIAYEALRRMPIDKVAFHLARIAIQAETDKVAAVLDVMVNGDGNANTAAGSFSLTALDTAAVVGTLTLKAWLAFRMKFANPYQLTTVLAQEGPSLQAMLLNVGSANVPLVTIAQSSGFGTFRAINPGLSDGVALGWTTDAPASKFVAFDQRFAVERVTEIGANVQEVEAYISRQTQLLTMTESEGYAIFDKNATQILDLAS